MNPRTWLWITVPIALSAGVLWLSAQEAKPSPVDGVKVTQLAESVQGREKVVAQKETQLRELEQRLNTLQSTLDRDREDLQKREKALQDAIAKFELQRTRPIVDVQLVRTYEAMEAQPGALALQELAKVNQEVAVSLLGTMQPKKAARIMDELARINAKLAGALSERVGISKPKAQENS